MTASSPGSANCVSWLVEPAAAGVVRLCDCTVLLTAGVLTHREIWTSEFLSGPYFHWAELTLLLIGMLLMMYVYELFHVYGPHILNAPRDHLVVEAHLVVSGSLLLLVLLLTTEPALFASWLLYWQTFTLAGVLGLRRCIRAFIRWWPGTARMARNVVIVGTPPLTMKVAHQLVSAANPAVRLMGLFHDSQSAQDPQCVFPVLGSREDLPAFARSTPIDEVIVALPWHAEDGLIEWSRLLRNIPCNVLLIPPDVAGVTPKCTVENVAGMALLKVVERPLSGWGYIIKSLEDRILAMVLLIALSSLMLAIAVLIRLDSPGPALFRQKRHGFNNNVIEVLKFRTMVAEASQTGTGPVHQATREDPRVTRFGRWLRRTSLDELPQLINVLKGEMSLVGPRPHALTHNEQYARLIDAYISRHRVKPGITGWAQVNGYRGETNTLQMMEKRVQLDLFYIENWSLLLDQLILIRTLGVVFFNRNAY